MEFAEGAPAGGRHADSSRRATDAVAGELARAYLDALLVGDPVAGAAVIDDGLRKGLSAVAIQSRVIAPSMWGIGKLWEQHGVSVAQEHLATAVSQHVLTRLYPMLLRERQCQRSGDMVVVAAVHGEHHVLGLRMVADVFEGAGLDVRFLGSDVPGGSLVEWVEEHRPAAVALGVTMPLGAAVLARQLEALRDRDQHVQLIVGGQGVPAALREGAGVLYAADTEQLAAHLRRSLKALAPGELPRDIAIGGVAFRQVANVATDIGVVAARLAQTTAAAADATRGEARRAFVLEQIAFRDALTHLWNRRAFDDRYQELTADGLRAPGILMIDVDHFKSINDRFGHEAGDRALVDVAQRMTGALRPGDFVARYGGDEFVVLLPDTLPEDAATIGERIRCAIASSLRDPRLTVSVGVSVPHHTDRRRAMLDVDRALYEAKEHGRNRAIIRLDRVDHVQYEVVDTQIHTHASDRTTQRRQPA